MFFSRICDAIAVPNNNLEQKKAKDGHTRLLCIQRQACCTSDPRKSMGLGAESRPGKGLQSPERGKGGVTLEATLHTTLASRSM